tara:strand:- start:240 stop:638 length:399 start_codon:yes stop_codon:yes gene_type:complete
MDISSITIECDIDTIYNFMSNIEKINLWSMGIHWDMNTKDNIVKGVSNYDQSVSYLKIVKKNNIKKIDYWIGKEIQNLTPRIYARITPTNDKDKNRLILVAFKTDDMDHERWKQLKELHQLELNTIKGLLSD